MEKKLLVLLHNGIFKIAPCFSLLENTNSYHGSNFKLLNSDTKIGNIIFCIAESTHLTIKLEIVIIFFLLSSMKLLKLGIEYKFKKNIYLKNH